LTIAGRTYTIPALDAAPHELADEIDAHLLSRQLNPMQILAKALIDLRRQPLTDAERETVAKILTEKAFADLRTKRPKPDPQTVTRWIDSVDGVSCLAGAPSRSSPRT
jgi:hypothetical protein